MRGGTTLRHWLLGAVGVAAFGLTAGRAVAQVLPSTGSDVRLGDMREHFERAFDNEPPTPTPGIIVTPGIDLTGNFVTNVAQGNGKTGSDFYFGISPQLAIRADTSRVKGSLFFAPQGRIYVSNSNLDQVVPNFNGSIHTILVPDTLFLDAKGAASQISRFGSAGPEGTTSLNRNNGVLNGNYMITPYLQHRFGGYGMVELGYVFAQTLYGYQNTPNFVPQSIYNYRNQNLTSNSGHLAFTTGEEFGRYNGGVVLSGTQYIGSGVMDGAHRYLGVVDLGVAVSRLVTVVGEVGYEDIRYNGTPVYLVQDAVWSGGIRLNPSPDTQLTVRYGHKDGITAPSINGFLAPSARTRVSIRYSEGLSTNSELLQNTLAASDLDATGQPIDAQTGVPLLLNDNFFGTQGGLYRTKSFSATFAWLLDRDVVSLGVNSQNQTLVATAVQTQLLGSKNNGTYGNVSWSHDWNPAVRSLLFFQYGQRFISTLTSTSPVRIDQTQNVVTVSAGVTWALSDTLTARAQYSYSNTSSDLGLQQRPSNLVTVGVHKTF